ncbi:MAG: outer membrane lipoprotein-sorting protein [Deltaproteobacteria bacterium]|nr:outer membrane lipoprotein-sorting protein [Deltaproteobacteria bacterium]
MKLRYWFLGLAFSNLSTPVALAIADQEVRELVKLVDTRQRNVGDYASVVFIDQKTKDGATKAFEARVYRRDADEKLMILFTKPKAEAGKGYLRLEKNLFLYEPALGKWERQTERASIAGTNSRRDDFDQSRLADEYDAAFVADENLGKFKVYHLKLNAKPGIDVASPIVELWIDQNEKNVMKRQEFALSGKLLRTSYYPSWQKMFSKSKGAEVYMPKEIRVFDEVDKGNATTVALREVKLEPLDANMFTKAWLESQSR